MTTTPTEREQLLELESIARAVQNQPYPIPANLWPQQIAMAMQAAGYRRPRTITTVAAVDKLLGGAVVLDDGGTIWEKLISPSAWITTGDEQWQDASTITLPATLLHDGGAA